MENLDPVLIEVLSEGATGFVAVIAFMIYQRLGVISEKLGELHGRVLVLETKMGDKP